MIEHLHIRDRAGNILQYVDINTLSQFKREEILNGKHILNIQFQPNVTYISALVKYNRIMFYDSDLSRWFEFIMNTITTSINSITVQCESSYYSTLGAFIPFVDITGNTVINGMYKLFEYAYPETEWSVGTSDITGSYYMQRTRSTLKEAIADWASKFGGEIAEEITVNPDNTIDRAVSLYGRIGSDKGVTIYDDREVTEFTRVMPQGDIYTAAYGYGQYDENGVATTFADIEWSTANGDPVDKPAGQTYVSLGPSVVQQFGSYVNGEYVDRCTFYSVDSTDPLTILEQTYASLISNIADPSTYTVKAMDFGALGLSDVTLELGDTVGVVVNCLGIKLQTRVVGKVTDYLNAGNNTFTFNTRPTYVTQSINQIAQNADNAQLIANESYYNSVLDRFNAEINADQAYVYADPLEGLNTYDALDPNQASKVTSIKGGSLRIANSQTDGQWNYTTVLTGDGLVVNGLTTQQISGENLELDLQSGVLSFGERIDGEIEPVMQFQSTGFTLLGDDTDAVFTPADMGFQNRASGAYVARFAADGTYTPTIIIDDEARIGKSRIIPAASGDVMWVIND